jgi:ubiquinone/menaquinone biosynthesis C-methylase UbiE
MKKEEKEARKKYNIIAKPFHDLRTKEFPKGFFYNELLEMPSTLELLGNVKGKKILDFGCGSGIYAKLLTKKGAKVKGFDISDEMLKIAKEMNPKLDLRHGSGYKIPFREKFDIVLAALVIHYFSDWDKVLRQVKKVLKKGGYMIISTGNPVTETAERIKIKGKRIKVFGDYFKQRLMSHKWRTGNVNMPFFHKTYETIIRSFIKNGFEIVDYKDCFPLKRGKKMFPKDYANTSKSPYFCVWKLRKK